MKVIVYKDCPPGQKGVSVVYRKGWPLYIERDGRCISKGVAVVYRKGCRCISKGVAVVYRKGCRCISKGVAVVYRKGWPLYIERGGRCMSKGVAVSGGSIVIFFLNLQ